MGSVCDGGFATCIAWEPPFLFIQRVAFSSVLARGKGLRTTGSHFLPQRESPTWPKPAWILKMPFLSQQGGLGGPAEAARCSPTSRGMTPTREGGGLGPLSTSLGTRARMRPAAFTLVQCYVTPGQQALARSTHFLGVAL